MENAFAKLKTINVNDCYERGISMKNTRPLTDKVDKVVHDYLLSFPPWSDYKKITGIKGNSATLGNLNKENEGRSNSKFDGVDGIPLIIDDSLEYGEFVLCFD